MPWDTAFRLGVLATQALVVLVVALTAVLFRLRLRNRKRERRWSELEERWEPLLLEILHGDGSPDSLWSSVGDEDVPFFLRFLTRFAERVRGEELTRLRTVAGPYRDALQTALEKPDYERRATAAQMIGALRLRGFESQLASALDDPAPLVRFAAAHALLVLGGPDDAREVVRRLDRFGPWSADALSSLLAAGGADARTLLRERLSDPSTPPDVAALAAQALRGMRDPRAADSARAALERESDREVVLECLRLLGEVGRAEHAPLVRSHADDPDSVVRSQAVRTLGHIGLAEDVDRLAAAVADPSPWVALGAAQALAGMGEVGLLRELGSSGGRGAVFALQAAAEESP